MRAVQAAEEALFSGMEALRSQQVAHSASARRAWQVCQHTPLLHLLSLLWVRHSCILSAVDLGSCTDAAHRRT